MKLNNKGQSLILFVLIIPITIGVMALVIDLGNAFVKKNSLDNITELVLEYGLDLDNDNFKYSESELEELMKYNSKVNSKVVINDKVIIIETKTNVDGIFSNILNIHGFKIVSKYKGYISNNKKIIQKEI